MGDCLYAKTILIPHPGIEYKSSFKMWKNNERNIFKYLLCIELIRLCAQYEYLEHSMRWPLTPGIFVSCNLRVIH
jgi:hypothetical protein